MNKVITSREEALKRLEELKTDLPKRKREINDVLRMIDLAKQSPRAGLNTDFIERVEMVWQYRKQDTAVMETMIAELEKMVQITSPPEPPKTTPPTPLKPVS